MPTGLDEDLVEVENDRVADQLADRLRDLGREGHRAEEGAVRRHRAELQVRLRLRVRLAVAVGGDVAQFAVGLEPIQLGPHRRDLLRRPEFRNRDPTLLLELRDLLGRKPHRRLPIKWYVCRHDTPRSLSSAMASALHLW
jgi:hypothetical protein